MLGSWEQRTHHTTLRCSDSVSSGCLGTRLKVEPNGGGFVGNRSGRSADPYPVKYNDYHESVNLKKWRHQDKEAQGCGQADRQKRMKRRTGPGGLKVKGSKLTSDQNSSGCLNRISEARSQKQSVFKILRTKPTSSL